MSNRRLIGNSHFLWRLLLGGWIALATPLATADLTPSDSPLFIGDNGIPLSLLVMGRDHKLYYEAYNDASDLNQDGELDVGYKPDLKDPTRKDKAGNPVVLDYYGYFDSHKCYVYQSGVFTPTGVTIDKTCSGQWSGDFLNYLTTSRLDALRRVLYGGYRSTDTDTETVLQRARIPQDAHSWGKEYESVTRDGYDITKYTPLSLPQTGTRHLFANTTLSATGDPLLRVLTDSSFRIWEWLSIERPVAGDQCATGNNSRSNCAHSAGQYDGYPNSHLDYDALVANFANAGHLQSTTAIGNINKPNDTADYYLTVIKGTLKVITAGTYELSVDGDDAVEVIVDGQVVAGWYGGHGQCGTTTTCRDAHKGSISLSSGNHTLEYRHQERSGGDNYFLYWKGPDSLTQWQIVPVTAFSSLVQSVYDVRIPASVMTDYVVRVKACVKDWLEPECKGYPSNNPTVYKPTGLLHEYGETDRMAFGLLTGSYKKHLSGGILRKNIASFKNEIDSNTGQFVVPADGGSIRKTIDSLAVAGFRYPTSNPSGNYYYGDGNCNVPMVNPMVEGRCAMWGNPIAEMMYEGVRYFAGKSGPTSAYDFDNSGTLDASLNLPKPDWLNPYRPTAEGGYLQCSKPFEVVISDIPSFDTDQLPGSAFASFSSDLSGLDVQSLANTIWGKETEGSRIFIGESLSNDPSYDAAPTAKNVTSFGNIRGLSPEEPTRQGGYYAGSVAYYAKTNDLNTAAPGNQKMDTFAVALSSPLPRIEMPLANNQIITLVPFAKTVGGCVGTYMPTNTIVDFYGKIFNTGTGNVDSNINGGRPYGMFSINYEDSEYGSDHDMDAIVTYVVSVNADNTLTVALSSNYAAGGCIQHMGYVISGTTKDGVYLEVRDSDTVNDVDYFLDTPPTFTETPPAPATASGWQDGVALPLTATRTFTPGQSSAVFIKHDPLWYAAKWGGFVEGDSKNNLPDKQEEWDRDKDGKPDAYFLVTNAGMLKEQLRETFEEILSRTGSAAAVALNTGAIGAGSRVYQALFHSGDWSGNVIAYNLDAKGKPTTIAWEAAKQLSDDSSRKIITFKPSRGAGIPFRWPNDPANPGTDELDDTQVSALNGTDGQGEERLNHLRGSRTDEDPSGKQYRKRGTTVLGDIVNSNPIYVGSPTYRYPDNADFTGYPAFRTSQKGRKPVIYVGANDGMLHALDADTGQELLGYVPGMVFDNLIELTKRNYSHRYFVDGSPTVGDVYFNSSWHTVLVGSLRAGGKGIYALDVTNPASFGEDKADELVLWERTNVDYGTDGDFSEIGFSFSEPSIVRMHNGKWVAVFGNGYNSSGTAVLFIVDIEDGRLIQKIDTGETGSPNGLSTPTVIDVDGDYIVDLIYVGDLLGNLWRFDVSSSSPTLWTFAKLFTASFTSATGETKAQPITSAPEVARHPFKTTAGKDTFVVLFGTGKYLEKSDVTNTDQQTFYGIWDNEGAPVTGRSELQQQTFTTTFSDDGRTFLVSSANTVDYPSKKGWYLDLKNAGERVANDPLLVGSRIIFTSILPSDDPCSYGGTSWLNVLDAVTGGRAKETFLRMRGENAGALVLEPNTNYAPTSVQFGGISSGPSMINTSDQLVIYTSTSGGGDDSSSGSDGDDEDDGCKPGEPCDSDLSPMDDFGRQSWRQVEFQ